MTDYHSELSSRHFDKSDILSSSTSRQFENSSSRHLDNSSSRHLDNSTSRHLDTSTSRSLNPELLMREFLHDVDDQVSSDEASSGFKSSFAREVMQNVRKNVTNQNGPARRYLAISQQGSINAHCLISVTKITIFETKWNHLYFRIEHWKGWNDSHDDNHTYLYKQTKFQMTI
jgi:hypothetical protein